MNLFKWHIQHSIKKALRWALMAFAVAYLLNACGDLLNPDEESNNVASNEEFDPASVQYIAYGQSNSTARNPASTNSGNEVGQPIGIGSGTGTSTSGGSGGFASSGGNVDEGSTSESSKRIIKYGDYDENDFQFFSKMTEPESTYTWEGKPFALQFVAIGKFPLKYTWYKKTENGKTVIGTNSTVFSKISSSTLDAGEYFATVEDSEGNILTSRTAVVKIRPSDLPCPAGEYGLVDGYNQTLIVQKQYVHIGYRHKTINLEFTPATHILELTCQSTIFENCSGELTYQCVGGKYQYVHGQCYCEDSGGGM
ncbi:MAG: hypothetical protein KDD58_09025 [Bdellovibrionales bacterium]|nr:hypothetical protein [Bdellovibrionales bacterium]